MPADHQPEDHARTSTLLAGLLRRNGWALAGIASATVLVELGAYATGRLLGIGPVASVLAALAAAAVWTALAAPAAAAEPATVKKPRRVKSFGISMVLLV